MTLTPEQADALRTRAETAQSLALKLGVRLSVVRAAAHAAGITLSRGRRRGLVMPHRYVIRDPGALHAHEIAARDGVSEPYVRFVAKRDGVKLPDGRSTSHPDGRARREAAYAMSLRGASYREIAAALGYRTALLAGAAVRNERTRIRKKEKQA